jgi:UDPglucose 6-dehydrogenase
VVVGKSTVPVGTARSIAADLALTSPNTVLVWNPEFLREGLAVKDTLEPDRIVYGLEDGERGQFGARTLDQIYSQALGRNTPKIETDYETAELVKVSANSFLALKISFINAVSRVCDATGASVTDLSSALGLDERIGPKFLRAGLGFGGGCLPKDLRAFSVRAAQLGAAGLAELLDQVDRINLDQRDHIVELTAAAAGPDLAGQRIAVLGVAFKPGTDDLRDSPALAVAAKLAQRGAVIAVYDPAAGPNLPAAIPNLPLTVAATPADAVKGATAVLVLTEWPEFSNLDPTELGPLVARPIVIDGRNTLDPALWRQSGWEYHGVGVR